MIAGAPNGSPEAIVDRGVAEGARLADRWAETFVRAVEKAPPGHERRIAGTFRHIAMALDVKPFADALGRALFRAAMLGGLDAAWETENDEPIKPVAFVRVELVGGVKDFATKPFMEAVHDFATRQVVTRAVFDKLDVAARRRAFTVAGLAKGGMLETAHAELVKSLHNGEALPTFAKRLRKRFVEAGWGELNPSHVENIFRTNIMSAYGSGRREQMTQPAVVAARPYWQILCVKDDRTRDTHKALDRKLIRADDPFWRDAAPPFGYNCRCRIVSRTQADVDRGVGEVITGADVKDIPDEGFDATGIAAPTVVQVPKNAPVGPPPAPVAPPPAPLPPPLPPPESTGPAQRTRQITDRIAIEYNPSIDRWGAYIDGEILRQPVLRGARWFRTEAEALRAAERELAKREIASGAAPPKPAPKGPAARPITARSMRAAGIRIEDGTGRETDRAIAQVFKDGAPTSANLLAAYAGPPQYGAPNLSVRGNESSWGATVRVHADVAGTKATRTFSRDRKDKLHVHHDYFALPESLQGKKIGETFLRNSMGEYRKMGVAAVSVDAHWVGRYTWAQFGFDWSAEFAREAVAPKLADFLVKRAGLGAAEAAQLAEAASAHSWDVASLEHKGRRIGKEFLLAEPYEGGLVHWNGEIRLDDENHPTFKQAKKRIGF